MLFTFFCSLLFFFDDWNRIFSYLFSGIWSFGFTFLQSLVWRCLSFSSVFWSLDSFFNTHTSHHWQTIFKQTKLSPVSFLSAVQVLQIRCIFKWEAKSQKVQKTWEILKTTDLRSMRHFWLKSVSMTVEWFKLKTDPLLSKTILIWAQNHMNARFLKVKTEPK